MAAHGIAPIDLVAVNLYPFEATVARGAAVDDCVENIDIGGPALIRAAAKNHDFVTVLTEPGAVRRRCWRSSRRRAAPRLALRRRLAGAAYARTAAYDAAIAGLVRAASEARRSRRAWRSPGTLRQTLRYGENPHQQAGLLRHRHAAPGRGHRAAGAGQGAVLQQPQRHRRRLRMRRRVRRADSRDRQARQPLRRRHRRRTLAEAWDAALRCDPVSAFGGIVAVNRTLDAADGGEDRRDLHRGDHRARRRRGARSGAGAQEEPAPAADRRRCPIRRRQGP